jgi:predicted RNA-binding protein with PIN domain
VIPEREPDFESRSDPERQVEGLRAGHGDPDGAAPDSAGRDDAGRDDAAPDDAERAPVGPGSAEPAVAGRDYAGPGSAERSAAESDAAEVGPAVADRLAGDAAEVEPAVLPEPVRRRVVLLAADALGALGADEVPASLRAVARFTPARRARHGGTAIAAALADPAFRQRVADRTAKAAGPVGEALAAGRPPAAADPVEVAALAYLLRPPGWVDLVAAAGDRTHDETVRTALAARDAEVARLIAQLDRLRTQSRTDVDRARAEAATLREELDRVRGRVRDLTRDLRAAEAEARRAAETLATERGRAAATGAATEAENRRLRSRLATAEDAIAAARQSVREGRSAEDARLWLLVETIGQAALGLRRELALTPPAVLPADLVEAETGVGPGAGTPVRALGPDDPARLDQLLALPRVHLVVDGYNVTKTGYGDLSLEQQRARLIAGVAVLAAQTGAEVTVVFDGAERLPAAPPSPRGVRVLFSRPGEIADEVIRRLVAAEPAGRPVVVVSTDREVADAVRRSGAYALASVALVRRLGRS